MNDLISYHTHCEKGKNFQQSPLYSLRTCFQFLDIVGNDDQLIKNIAVHQPNVNMVYFLMHAEETQQFC